MMGFDCSGLVQEILAPAGVDPPGDQSSHALYIHFLKHGILRKKKKAYSGDLAFFGKKKRISHVGFAIDSYKMVEAAGGDERTRTLTDAQAHNAYVRVRPIRSRRDLVAIIAPKYWNY